MLLKQVAFHLSSFKHRGLSWWPLTSADYSALRKTRLGFLIFMPLVLELCLTYGKPFSTSYNTSRWPVTTTACAYTSSMVTIAMLGVSNREKDQIFQTTSS